MSDVDTVHMFWHGGALPPLAQACVTSFAARGHRVAAWTYDPAALPAGVTRADAREVIADTDPLHRLCRPGSIAAFADCFRYRLLAERGGWWMDTDVYCLTDALPAEPRAWAEQEPGIVNNAILRFPAGDPLAARLATLARERAREGLHWGAIGPELVTEVLRGQDRAGVAGTRSAFYPLHWLEAHHLWLPERRDEVAARTAGAKFIHCWARALENAGIDPWLRAPAGSRLAEMLRGTSGARALTPWRHAAIRRRIHRAASRDGTAGGAGAGAWWIDEPGIDRAVTWLRRSVVIPLRASRMGLRLPPGRLDRVQHLVDTDRGFFLDRARRCGPVFKALVHDSYTTCVVGHSRGARLIAAHEPKLAGWTVDLTGLFPIGALRGMSGETHRKYRRQFLRAVQATPLEAHADRVERLMREAVLELAAAPHPVGGDALRERLRRLSTSIMMRLLYGLEAGTPEHDALAADYRRFGPKAPVSRIRGPHARAFESIDRRLRARAEAARHGDGGAVPPCVLAHIARSGEADDTSMGNLAYLLEAAHFDVYSLWHWMLRLIAGNPRVQEAYAAHPDAGSRRAYARAIALETLRMEQSELLYWRVAEDIAFDGYLIPRGTRLRVCIWEGHKDEATFAAPFWFEPERFLENRYGLDAFAPFGLGARRCLGADLVLDLSTMLVQVLLDAHRVEMAADGAPFMGPYHWQPGPAFALRLRDAGAARFMRTGSPGRPS